MSAAGTPHATTRFRSRQWLRAAIVDRLAFGGNILETGTDSYRLAQTRAQQAAAS
jgi:hypothetical protein